MGVEALIRKILGFLGGAGHYNSAGQSNWEVFWFGWGCRDSKFQLSSGNIKWVGVRIKLCWSDDKF